jgi:MtN3 and saliva related transmembrane protein
MITILGLVASFLTVAAYLPQVIKSWKTKKTKDLSFVTFVTFSIASLLWIAYGVYKKDIAIILTNSILLVFQLSILFLKFKNQEISVHK